MINEGSSPARKGSNQTPTPLPSIALDEANKQRHAHINGEQFFGKRQWQVKVPENKEGDISGTSENQKEEETP